MRSLVVVLGLLAFPLAAQQPLVETFEVRVVNVDVVVTDRAGNPVPGLTAKDFEILEEKRPQAITNFYEVRDGAAATTATAEQPAAPAVKPRHFILFIENRAMQPVLRKHVLKAMKQFVDEKMKPGDEATVVSWNEALSIDAPLTSDKTVLHAALDGIAQTTAVRATKGEFARVQQRCNANLQMAKSGRMAIRMAYEDCIGEARTEAARLTMFSRMLLNSLDVAMTTVAGIDGRKILVMAGTELPLRPGMDMFGWANNLYSPFMFGFDAAIQRPPADQEREQRDMLETLARSANAHGVTLYMLSVLMPMDAYGATSDVALDDGGGDFRRANNTEDAHELLAKLTGGTAESLSRIDKMFDTIGRDLGSYYSLGYKPSEDIRGTRPITVRTKNRNYLVRARQSYAPKTTSDQMADRVVANVFAPAPASEWPIELRIGAPQRVEKGKYTVPVEIVAPANDMTLIPRDGKLAGGFMVFVAVGNAQGQLSTTFRQPNGIEILPAEEQGFRQTPITFTATMTLREGENLLSVGMVDQLSNVMGFARATITAK